MRSEPASNVPFGADAIIANTPSFAHVWTAHRHWCICNSRCHGRETGRYALVGEYQVLKGHEEHEPCFACGGVVLNMARMSSRSGGLSHQG
ncbi:hypothetical protein LY78DRAFT_404588 [Colletotrichum sublineola]|nr:hypothetical protein LY78DRAFT_404588 [Colletotrichum sublineola]